MKKFLTAIALMGLVGCGSETKTSQEPKTESQEPSVEWYQDNLEQTVEKVGTDNADKILKSAGLTAHKVSDGTDSKGEPKKIYAINDGLTAQLEHSPNNVIIAWYQAEDSQEKSQKTVKDAYLLARAMFGQDGAEMVRRVSNGGAYKDELVAGHTVNGSCAVNPCTLNISTKPQ